MRNLPTRTIGLVAFALGVATLGAAQLHAESVDADPRAAYVQALDQLRGQLDARRGVIDRIARLRRIADYLKTRLRENKLDPDDKKAMKAELARLDEAAQGLSAYLKSSSSYSKEIEAYLDTLKTTNPDLNDWEKARRAAWKNGEALVRVASMPPGPVAAGQEILVEALGVPTGARVVWNATVGTVKVAAQPESGAMAVWKVEAPTMELGQNIKVQLRADVLHPKIKYPESILLEVTLDEHAGEPTSENARQFVGSLANLINSELALEQARTALASNVGELDALRAEDPKPADFEAEQTRLRTQESDLEARIESLATWIAYIDHYELPSLAEADSSVHRWELQRQDILTRLGGPKCRWPWLVRSIEATTPDRWRFAVADLPEGTSVDWRISHADGSQVEVDGEGSEIEIAADRSESEVLSAYVDLRHYDLPLRLDWYLPATTTNE